MIINMNIDKYKQLLAYVLMVHYPQSVMPDKQQTVYVFSSLSEKHSDFLVNLLDNKKDVLYQLKKINGTNFKVCEKEEELLITNDTHLNVPNQIIINDFPSEIDIIHIKDQIRTFLQTKKGP